MAIKVLGWLIILSGFVKVFLDVHSTTSDPSVAVYGPIVALEGLLTIVAGVVFGIFLISAGSKDQEKSESNTPPQK